MEPEDDFVASAPVQGVPLIYVNWLRTIGTPIDLAIDVGYQAGNQPPQAAARLTMSWEQAKLLHESLGQVIEGYEGEYGATIRDLKQHLVSRGSLAGGEPHEEPETRKEGEDHGRNAD